MICYACGIKAQNREIRAAKKENRQPQITDRCGSWEKGQCETCRKRKTYVTPISDFMRVTLWLSTTYAFRPLPAGPKSLQGNDLRLYFLPKQEGHDSKNLHQQTSSTSSTSTSSKPLATVTSATHASDSISNTSSQVTLSLITENSIAQTRKMSTLKSHFFKLFLST